MTYDAGTLARLFQINFAPSFHYQLPNPGFRTGTELSPIKQAKGFRVYYSSGFLPSGSGQTSIGGTLLSGLATGLQTFLPSLFGGGGAVARTPPILPTKGVSAPPTTPSGIAGAVQQHPIAAIAGSAAAAAATMGAGSMAIRSLGGLIGGGHARYGQPGQKGYHMIKKGPHAGMWARNRRRNVGNIRALRRALSRAHGFERICRKVMHFTHPGKARGRAVFKRRRRSR